MKLIVDLRQNTGTQLNNLAIITIVFTTVEL